LRATWLPEDAVTANKPVRTPRDDAALRAYWAFYEPSAHEVSQDLRARCLEMPAFAEIVRSMPLDEAELREARSLELQRMAVVDGRWAEYLADLTQQGASYASMGVGFGSWFEVIAAFRDLLRTRLAGVAATDLERATLIGEGMNRFIDISMSVIGEAYLAAKEEIIRDQQEAIREISTPVLQIRDQVLILPIVGLVDTHRARQITESVLEAIRARRARAVVMDITGVPIVDSKVAKHLAQTCESARLMGALVIVTGISQEIAQTLVTIGADLSSVRTLGDLQSGVEEVELLFPSAGVGTHRMGPS
jgi:anti-anti-sigma factor